MLTQRSSQRGWLQPLIERWANTLVRLPRWLSPIALWASIGAALLFFMTVARGLFIVFTAPAHPKVLLAFLGALVVASAAGAIAGAFFPIIRIPLRYLGFIGDLLTGPILGCVYMLAILVPAKYLFHDDELQTRGDWLTALAFGGGFGVVGTIVYWYQSWRERKGR